MPIRKVKKNGKTKWKIENTPGLSDTKENAIKRLRAIKVSQKKKRSE
jgi:hypothetical protein